MGAKMIDRIFFWLLIFCVVFTGIWFARAHGLILRNRMLQRVERQIEELHNPPD